MTDVCYECGRPRVSSEDPRQALLEAELSWYELSRLAAGEIYKPYYNLKGQQFTLLQKQTYTENCQGQTTDCFLVFRDESTGKVYKKLGRGDSYGDLEWDGALFPVAVREKMVTVWEVEE